MAVAVPCCVVTVAVGALMCSGVIFGITVVGFMARFRTEAAACSVSAVFSNVSEFVALEALRGLDVAFEELAMMGLVAPVDLLMDHFICLFGLSDTDQEGSLGFVALEGLFLEGYF